MTLSPSPEKVNKNVPATSTFQLNGPSFENLTKRTEIALKDQAAVRRTKKAKLNDLYFNSQVKDLIFYQQNEEQSGEVNNSSMTLPKHRR